jgi:hypothetical protein
MGFQGLMLFTGCLNLYRACGTFNVAIYAPNFCTLTSFFFAWHELYKTELRYNWLEIERRCLKNTCQKIKARCSDIQRQQSNKNKKKKEASGFILEYERVGRDLYTVQCI